MGGCLSSKLRIITPSFHSNPPSISNDNPQQQPHPSSHFLALLHTTPNKLPKPPTTPTTITHNSHHHQPIKEKEKEEEDIIHVHPPSFKTTSTLALDYYVSPTPTKGFLPAEDHQQLHLATRSFHTFEEYDALLHNIIRSSQSQSQSHSHSLQNSDDDDDDIASPIIIINSHPQNSQLTDDADDTQVVCTTSRRMRESKSKNAAADDDFVLEEEEEEELDLAQGSKRKRKGKGLGLLQVPLPPNLADVYSPPGLGGSNYVTPKFGSYNVTQPPPQPRMDEESIEPDLVAAFEEGMLQLKLEEDELIKQIDRGGGGFDRRAAIRKK